MSKVYFAKHLGRYDFANNVKDWNLSLYTPYGNVSDMWPEDEEPEIDGLMPSEVLALIEARIKHWIFKSNRSEKLATVEFMRAHANEIDMIYAAHMLERAEKEVKRWYSIRGDLMADAERDAS